MRRLAFLMIPVMAAVSGCGGPVETRVQTQAGPALPALKQYSFPEKPEQNSQAYQAARQMVGSALEDRGFAQSKDAPLLVHIALANRPASIAMTTGEESGLDVIADKKERKPLQSCEDVEHRLTINMFTVPAGEALYSGTAAEYHCKGTVEQSLPYLVDAALSDLGSPGTISNSRTITRKGIE
jgi:hypothetical protein